MTIKTEISTVLSKLGHVLPPEVAPTLRAPAQAEDIAALASAFTASGSVPEDLLALLNWHDGQNWNSPLSRRDNRRLLSAREILSELSFFADPMSEFMEPWSASWLPVLTNDSGDFLVYETQGELKGALLRYWHDDSSRGVEYSSLLQWAERLLHEYEQPRA